jgi:hypothetical protein
MTAVPLVGPFIPLLAAGEGLVAVGVLSVELAIGKGVSVKFPLGVPSVKFPLVGLSVGEAAGVEVIVVYTVTIGGSSESVQSPPSSGVVLLSAAALAVGVGAAATDVELLSP